MKKHLTLILTAVLALSARSSWAVPIAIIDSGTDLSHPDLVNKQWTNEKDPEDAVDNDDNGYVDDTHGWNFAENNNKLYDKTLLGKYSPDIYKFFEIQLRVLTGQSTDDDKTWMKAHKGDQYFMGELSSFGNWMHGTHVAGISAKDADKAQIMALKILPTPPIPERKPEQPAPQQPADPSKPPAVGVGGTNPVMPRLQAEFASAVQQAQLMDAPQDQPPSGFRQWLLQNALKLLASQQGRGLAPVAKYVHDEKARVANCSFGTSTTAVKPLLKNLITPFLGHDPSDEELTGYAVFFVNQIVSAMSTSFVGAAKDTLFVIAAGNDGQNNDQLPSSPANVKADNAITVAATWGYGAIASFSNYGTQMVDVAAPGVGILSTIPGPTYLAVSGTSQASPFVANIAGRVLDENPSLTPADVKKIIMDTADKKEFLHDKVMSSGIANAERAIAAARLSKSMALTTAVDHARSRVRNIMSFTEMPANADLITALPLPMPLF